MRFLVWTVALAMAPAFSWAQTGTGESFLELGRKQVVEGDFEFAVFSLDTAIRRLQGDSRREASLVQACLHLGIAYVGLDHEPGARGKFREALRLAPGAQLPASLSSPRVVKLFEEERLKLAAEKSKKKRMIAIAVAGGVAATAVGVSGVGAAANREPSVQIAVWPGNYFVRDVSLAHFHASAADPEGGSLTYTWDFGDGHTDQGVEVTHVFERDGTFHPSVTVTDDQGANSRATTYATVWSVSGDWREPGGLPKWSCTQTGSAATCRTLHPDDVPPGNQCVIDDAWLTLADPRQIVAGAFTGRCGSARFEWPCQYGELGSGGGMILCFGSWGRLQWLRQ